MVPAKTFVVTCELDPRGVVPATSAVKCELDLRGEVPAKTSVVTCELDPRGVVPAKTSVVMCELDPRGVVPAKNSKHIEVCAETGTVLTGVNLLVSTVEITKVIYYDNLLE